MQDEGAVFGGESSGHFFYKREYGTYEMPMILVLNFLNFLSGQGKSLSEIVSPYKKYVNSGEINTRCESDEVASQKVELIKEKYKSEKQILLDGLSVEMENVWFNVRASNTEPLLRLTVEAKDQLAMEKMRDELLDIIRS